jgi:hypothetical protein
MNLGVEIVHRETFGSSLELMHDTLLALEFGSRAADDIVAKFRAHDESMLQQQRQFYGDEKQMIRFAGLANQQLAELFRSDRDTPRAVGESGRGLPSPEIRN